MWGTQHSCRSRATAPLHRLSFTVRLRYHIPRRRLTGVRKNRLVGRINFSLASRFNRTAFAVRTRLHGSVSTLEPESVAVGCYLAP